MRISFNSPHFLTSALVMSCLIITACGGGGSGSKQPTNQSSTNSSVIASSTATTSSAVAQDTTPEAFSFTAKTDAAVNTEYTSNAITVKGIDIAVPVSITGGSYSINGGDFTSAAGTVSAGQTITVKTTSGSKTEVSTSAVLTIGGVTGTFTVTTVTDTFAPVSEFKFPTPYTMSEANEVKVRGTASDENTIKSVKLLVGSTEIEATPKAETNGVKDFSSWTATIPLTANVENEIKVIATDDRNNRTLVANANKVTIRQAPIASAFPDEVNQFERSRDVVLGKESDLVRLFVSTYGKIWEVEVESGKRKLFIDHNNHCSSNLIGLTIDYDAAQIYGLCYDHIFIFDLNEGVLVSKHEIPYERERTYRGLSLDKLNGRNRLVMVDSGLDETSAIMISFSLDTKEFSILSSDLEEPAVKVSQGDIAIFDNYYLVPTGGQIEDASLHNVIRIDAVTGKRTILTDNSTGSGELFSALLPSGSTASLTSIASDVKNSRVFLYEGFSAKLFTVDLQTGARELFKDMSYIESSDEKPSFYDLDFYEKEAFLLMPDNNRNGLIIFDLETKEKVILSKSKNDF